MRTPEEIAAAQTQGIAKSWSLLAFAKEFGRMFIGNFTNKETGEKFTACQFGEQGNYTMVAFSEKLGTLTPREVVEQKDHLQVVKLSESGSYVLCHQGENAWQEVGLF